MPYCDKAPEFEYFASCLPGLEPLLADELKALKVRRVRPLGGGVAFFGDALAAERVCLWSRVAARVLLVVGRVEACDADALYEGAVAISWEDVVASGASIAVRARGTNEELRNTRFTALKIKDAVCDRLRERTGERPNVDAQNPDLVIDVRVNERRATISVDLSGESLHKRSYLDERDGDDAPLGCAHAAALLQASGWKERFDAGWGLFDPVCGDGFVVTEAASAAADLAPGLLRPHWGFFAWAAHSDEAWDALLAEADERFDAGLARLLGAHAAVSNDAPDLERVRIVGVSASSPSVARSRDHLKRAGLRQVASVEAASADDASAVLERVEGVVSSSCADGALARSVSGGEGSAVGAEEFASEGEQAQREKHPALVVASVAPLDRDSSDARAVSEAAAFAHAAQAALQDSLFAAVGVRSHASRFGVSPSRSVQVGRGRVEALLEVFDQPPAKSCSIVVPDSFGGADHVVEVHDGNAEQFASRLRKVFKERRKWAKREGVSCYRVYDADLPDYAAAIDIYDGAGEAAGKRFVHVAEYQAPSSIDPELARRRFDDVLALVPVVLGVRPDHVFSKVRERSRGGAQYRSAGRRSYVTHTEEMGLLFEVDLAGYLDTGLFLDHRDTRALVGSMAQGTRFLNLFAYTGSATVHAAAGGAASTTTVDLSSTYLEWAQRNMEANGFSDRSYSYVRSDVMTWIRDARRAGERYDLIFVDPPTFSNSKSMGARTWDVQRDHVELLVGVSRLLSRGGLAVFSCNLRTFKPDFEELERLGVELEDISPKTIPHDFERNPRIHKCYILRRAKKRD